MTAIPRNIEKEHIIQAINEIDLNGIPERRKSKNHFIFHNGNRYPQKYVLSLANKFVNGKVLEGFNANQAQNFLKKFDFSIEDRENINYPIQISSAFRGDSMEIEGTLSKAKQYSFKDSLRDNKMYLQSLVKDEINLPSILVKYMEKTDFEEIWGKPKRCDEFYDQFIIDLQNLRGNQRDSDDSRDDYLRDLLQKNYCCEPIVAFLSDLNFKSKELEDKHSNKIITSPGIYVKEKDDDEINLDFGILYSLIKAQIYYSMSRTDILTKYKGIDSVIYSALALKVMKDKDFENLIEHQKNARKRGYSKLAGSWAIPLDLLIITYDNKNTLDIILDEDLIRSVFFGENIDEERWSKEITERVLGM